MFNLVQAWVLSYASLPFAAVICWELFINRYRRHLQLSDHIGGADLLSASVVLSVTLWLIWHCFQVVSLQIGWGSLVFWLWTWLYLLNGPIIPFDTSQRLADKVGRWLLGL